MMQMCAFSKKVITVAILFAGIAVALGAYTRLTHAGLGCPDWPGCYGQLRLPSVGAARDQAQTLFPDQPIEAEKAWTEMLHRYVAGSLVLLIMLSLFLNQIAHQKSKFPIFLAGWILFQACLGMWTVTWRLLPIVVTAHLLSGALLFVGLCLYRCELASLQPDPIPQLRKWLGIAVAILLLQIALGGWVSSNYAGIACVGFPKCNGQWLPLNGAMEGFFTFSPIGPNYQGGLLQSQVRASIQMVHRLGAVVTAAYLLWTIYLIRKHVRVRFWRRMTMIVLGLVSLQWCLGILNVIYFLPLTVAVMHNMVAVLLLAQVTMMWFWSARDSHAN